ncbi:MAG: hypothetical protein AB8E87_13155 [Prochlorococcus sp.]
MLYNVVTTWLFEQAIALQHLLCSGIGSFSAAISLANLVSVSCCSAE